MIERIGPTRLILLNCGKFDYAEIDLDVPLHLVGPNNIGKTSLIALLQFLYVDEQSKMRFSRDMPTTRKYYFPDISSFALFESLSPEGFMLTGVHGLGPVRKYDIERFVCQGQYQRSDFLSQDNTIMPWDQIKANLSSKGFVKLKPASLRAALIGNTLRKGTSADTNINLSLVPLRKRVGYKRFCSVFLNLLRLSHLRQEELKRLLLELFEVDFTKRQINLQDDFAPQLDQLQRQKADVQDLKRNETAIRQILADVKDRDKLRSSLKAVYALIGQLFNTFKIKTDKRLQELACQLEIITSDTSDMNDRLQQINTEHNEKLQKKGRLDQIQQTLNELKEQCKDYHPTWTDAQILELQKKINNLESTLESVKLESPETIEQRLNDYESKHQLLTKQIENIEHSMASILIDNLGVNQTGKLSRLFNEGILRLSTDTEDAKAKIHNINSLSQQLSALLDCFQGTTYQDESITLMLEDMRHFDPKDFLDPKRLREQLLYLSKAIQQTKDTLNAAKNHQAHINELDEQKTRLETLLEKRSRFREYQKQKQDHKDINKQTQTVQQELDQLQTQLAEINVQQKDLDRKKIEMDNERDKLQRQLERMDCRIEDMLRPEDTWLEAELVPKKMELSDAIEHYRQISSQYQHLANRIDGELETIHSQTYGRYQGDNEQETLDLFGVELDSLKEKQDALQQNWISFTVQLKKDFKELNRDMDTLKAKIHSLNGQLAKIHISNLANLKITLSSHAEFRRHFTQVQSSEAAPLFADAGKTDESMRKISQMLQERPVIALEDMFEMHFEITTPQGVIKKYDHLDRIESNGTTTTIKILINLILLRGLLANDSVNIPFYLDECSSLDSENLRSIVQQARHLGFIAVLASPEAMDAADRLYYLSEHKGRVTLNPQQSLVEIVRSET